MKKLIPILIPILTTITIVLAIVIQNKVKPWSEMKPGEKRMIISLLSIGGVVLIGGIAFTMLAE